MDTLDNLTRDPESLSREDIRLLSQNDLSQIISTLEKRKKIYMVIGVAFSAIGIGLTLGFLHAQGFIGGTPIAATGTLSFGRAARIEKFLVLMREEETARTASGLIA